MRKTTQATLEDLGHEAVLAGVGAFEAARRVARAVNTFITSTYWTIGRRIVEQEQHGHACAGYDAAPVDRLAVDLTARFGRGFGRNLFQMRAEARRFNETEALRRKESP